MGRRLSPVRNTGPCIPAMPRVAGRSIRQPQIVSESAGLAPQLPVSHPPATSVLRHAARGTPHPLPSRCAPGAPVADLSIRRQRAETARPPLPTPPERPPVSESPTWEIAPCVRLPERARHARHLRRIRIRTPAPAERQQRENTVTPAWCVSPQLRSRAVRQPPRLPKPTPRATTRHSQTERFCAEGKENGVFARGVYSFVLDPRKNAV